METNENLANTKNLAFLKDYTKQKNIQIDDDYAIQDNIVKLKTLHLQNSIFVITAIVSAVVAHDVRWKDLSDETNINGKLVKLLLFFTSISVALSSKVIFSPFSNFNYFYISDPVQF